MLSDFVLDLQEEEETWEHRDTEMTTSPSLSLITSTRPQGVLPTSFITGQHGDRSPTVHAVPHESQFFPKIPLPKVTSPHVTSPSIKQERLHECPVCSKSFTRKAIYLDHYRSQHSEQRILCSICNKPFKRQNDCRRHEKLHSGEKDYQCRAEVDASELGCGKRFARLHSLKEHQKRRVGTSCHEILGASTSPIKAEESASPADTSSSDEDEDEYDDEDIVMQSVEPVLYGPRHIQHVEDEEDWDEDANRPGNTSACKTIESTHVSWPSVLEGKIRQHAGRVIAAAHENKLPWYQQLDRSVPSPTSASLFHCFICPSRYSTAESFKYHLKHHFHELEERPYHCSPCGVKFSLMQQLTKHQPHCTGSFGLFHCSWGCGRSFAAKADLTQHANRPDGTNCYENVRASEASLKEAIMRRLKE